MRDRKRLKERRKQRKLEEDKKAFLIIIRNNEHRKADSTERMEEIRTCDLCRHCMY